MKIVTAWYGPLDSRLLAMCRASVRENTSCELTIAECRERRGDEHHRYMPKMEAWNAAAQSAEEDLLLIDADCLVLRDPSVVFEKGGWDIAHAPRPGPFRYNTGVVFVRPTIRARRFMQAWVDRTYEWGMSAPFVAKSKELYGGVDQASFADTIADHRGRLGLRVREIDYTTWNLCQDFKEYRETTGIVHLKGRVSRDILIHGKENRYPKKLVRLVRKWEAAVV